MPRQQLPYHRVMKLWSFVAACSLVGCLVTNPPPPTMGPRTNQPQPSGGPTSASASAPPVAGGGASGGCFAGEWKGGGDDINHRHLGFAIQFVQDGSALHGTFDYTFEFGKTGTEEVSGTADCASGTAELRGSTVTGDAAPAHYKLKLMPSTPLSDGRVEAGFEGTWDCDPCVPGSIKGYTVR